MKTLLQQIRSDLKAVTVVVVSAAELQPFARDFAGFLDALADLDVRPVIRHDCPKKEFAWLGVDGRLLKCHEFHITKRKRIK